MFYEGQRTYLYTCIPFKIRKELSCSLECPFLEFMYVLRDFFKICRKFMSFLLEFLVSNVSKLKLAVLDKLYIIKTNKNN